MNRPALSDNRPLEWAVLQEIYPGPDLHAAFDAGPGDDPITNRGVRITEKDQRILDQNGEIDPATLTGVLLVEISAIGAGILGLVAFGRHR